MDIEELDDKVRKLEIKVAYRSGSIDRHIERFQRAIIRTSATRDLHNSEISAIKPVLERLDRTNNVFDKFEIKVSSIANRLRGLQQKVDTIGKVDILKGISKGVLTFVAGALASVLINGVLHSRGTNAQSVNSKPVSQSRFRPYRTPTYKDARID
jgi:hypothetical protein